MPSIGGINRICLALLPVCLLVVGWLLYSGHPFLCLLSLGGVMLCVRTRARMGYRGPRKRIFKLHMLANAAFLICLVLLVLAYTPTIQRIAWISFAGMSLTGIALIYQSWHPLSRMPAPGYSS